MQNLFEIYPSVLQTCEVLHKRTLPIWLGLGLELRLGHMYQILFYGYTADVDLLIKTRRINRLGGRFLTALLPRGTIPWKETPWDEST